MSSDRIRRMEELFQGAADLPVEERRDYLEEHAGDDEALRGEVEELLAVYDRGAAPTPPTPGSEVVHSAVGERIGRFKILGQIGEGGCGVVYLARQTDPVRRTVALKVIKEGMDTRQVVARFDAERQALALMDHPNIATVFDAGVTDAGRPYFAMEHVPGERITTHCDRRKLDVPQRLRLFLQVCDAIQHAHQRGIIHRDIKPSNVLVEVVGDHPVPKVIDFGIAKAISGQLTERTLFTEQGQLVGTPEYMSPEQAEMTGLHVDTRTDIYALGVVLYELLTGTLPFDPETLREGTLADIQNHILNQDPPKPSTRVSTGGDEATTHARARRTDAPELVRRLRGDLDWITMKALEKDRARRYASASELAADVERHLHDEPILARPPSLSYRFSKFARRNRALVVSAALILLCLLLGIVGTTLGMLEARAAQRREAAEREVARDEAIRAGAVRDFLFYALGFDNPAARSGKELTVRRMLELATDDLDELFPGQPKAQANVLSMLGLSRYYLCDFQGAEEALQAAREILEGIDPDHRDLAQVLWTLIYVGVERSTPHEERRRLRVHYLRICVRDLERECPELARKLHEYGDCVLAEERPERDEVVARFQAVKEAHEQSGASSPESFHLALGQLVIHLANVHEMTFLDQTRYMLHLGRLALYEEADTRGRLQLRLALALRLYATNPAAPDGLAHAEELDELCTSLFPAPHIFRALAKEKLGKALAARGRTDEAEQLHLGAYRGTARGREGGYRRAFGVVLTLASFYRSVGRAGEAAPYLDAELEGLLGAYGDLGPQPKQLSRVSWAVVQSPGFEGRLYQLALQAAERAVEQVTEEYAWHALRSLGVARFRVGQFGDAEQPLRRSFALCRHDARGVADIHAALAMVLHALGRQDEALRALERANDRVPDMDPGLWGDAGILVREARARVGGRKSAGSDRR